MPRPHYQVRAGAVMPQPPAARNATGPTACPGCTEKSAEIERLRAELAQARGGGPGALGGRTAVMWAALAICAACIVFALAAMMRHG